KRRPKFQFYWMLIVVTVIIAAIFSKYAVVRYQLFMILTAYLFGIVACFKLLQPHSRNWFRAGTLLVIVMLAPVIKNNLATQYHSIGLQFRAAQAMHDYSAQNPEGVGTIVEIAFTRDYSLVFVRDWANGFLNAQLAQHRGGLFTFKPPYFQTVMNTRLETFPTMQACWDRLIVQNSSVQGFLESNPHLQFKAEKIPDTTATVVKSAHCQKPF
ncbi:MAG: hypothetical protein K2X47_06760, partial [Bdellovibrionales bacterium]|nr:hypothetical protein [Bdellovibrionales bacterium]